MASSSFNAIAHLEPPVSEKLTRDNFLLWKAQVLPPIRGAQLEDILDGTDLAPAKTIEDDKKQVVPNSAYSIWLAKDQQVLGYIVNSLSTTVLAQVATLKSASEVWRALEGMYSAQSRARVTNLRKQLANLKKGSMSVAAYFNKMKTLGDKIAAAGKPMDDDEMVSFIMNGLDHDYNPIVSSVLGRSDPISVNDLFTQVMSYELLLEMLQDQHNGGQYQSSANSASRGRGSYNNRGRGSNRGRGCGGHGSGGNYDNSKTGQGRRHHQSLVVRFVTSQTILLWSTGTDTMMITSSKVVEKKSGGPPTAYGVDTNWYVDSGASDHVTADLEKMSVRDKYGGHDQVHTANGSGMRISNIGHASLHTPVRNLLLRNILHVPSAHKSLASVHRLALDNNVYFEFHPNFFLIKDRATMRVLH